MNAAPPDAPVDDLIERYLNDALDAEGLRRLSSVLLSSEDAARRFAQAARFDHALRRHFTRSAAQPATDPHRVRLAGWRQRREHLWGPAAAIAIHAALVVFLVRWAFYPTAPRRDEEVTITLEKTAQPVALDGRPPMPARTDEKGAPLPAPAVSLPAPNESDEMPAIVFLPQPSDVRGIDDGGGAGVLLSEPHWTVRNRLGESRRARRVSLGGAWAEEAERTAADGAAWIARTQSADGAWREEGAEPRALTSLAAMALLARGASPRDGRQSAELRGALTYLTHNLSDRPASVDPRTLALQLSALADAVAVSRLPSLQAALDVAVQQALAAEQAGGGWGMSPSEPDPVVTAWMTHGLRTARAVGTGDQRCGDAIARAVAAMNYVASPAGAGLFYPPAEGYAAAKWSQIAGAVVTLLAGGETSGPRIQRGLRALDAMPASWPREGADGTTAESIWLATIAHMESGGPDGLRWFSRLAPSLLAHRGRDGAWRARNGHPSIGITAMAVLILEAPYRYPPAGEWIAMPELAPTAVVAACVPLKHRSWTLN